MDSKESPVGVVASWAALVASFALSFATWVSLAELAGFNGSVEVSGVTLRLSWAMAIAVDGYVVSALVTWMAPVSDEIARFAKANTYAGAAVGVLAQSAYHGLSVQHGPSEGWKPYLAAVVGALPPLAAGLSVHLRALVRRAHLSSAVRPDAGQPDTRTARAWTPAPDMSAPDILEPVRTPDTLTVPDMDTLPDAPADVIPVQRRTRPDSAWKVTARRIMSESPNLSHAEVAGKVMAEHPDTWSNLEAGRKAVSRLA